MTDVKSVPSPTEQVFIVPSAPPTAGAVAQGIGTPTKEAKESDPLELDNDEMEFLESEYRKKFLTEFKIGKLGITLYGSPMEMSFRSDLIKGLLGPMSESKAPYIVGEVVDMMRNPLVIVWLYMNRGGTSSGMRPKVDKLSFDEWVNMFEIMSYFGIEVSDSNRLGYSWLRAIQKHVELRQIGGVVSRHGATRDEVRRNAPTLIKILDKLRTINSQLYNDMFSLVINNQEIISNTHNIPVIRLNPDGRVILLGTMERKSKEDINEIEKFWTPDRIEKGKRYYTFPRAFGNTKFVMIQLPNIVAFAPEGTLGSSVLSYISKMPPQ